jgi:hypothetical protein
METKKIIDELIEVLDIEKIHKTMVFLEWKWADSSDNSFDVPTKKAIEKTAKYLINKALNSKDKNATIGTGGLVVEKTGKDIKIRFELTSHWVTI